MAGLLFYRIVFIPIWITWLLLREAIQILQGKTKASDLAQRLGAGPKTSSPVIWLHGASLGEIGPAKVLAEAILARRPDHELVISAHAPHARDLVASWGLPRTHAALPPLDMAWSTRRFLRGFPCRMHITIENELWPNRFILLARAGIPIVAVSARMSARSLKHWHVLGSFPRRLMSMVTWLAAQAPDSRANLLALGLSEDRLLPDLNLKALAPPKRPTADDLAPFAPHFRRDLTVLGASTHITEEEHLLGAFAPLAKHNPDLRLIIAPRSAARGDEVAALVRDMGLTVALRSRGETPTAQVYVADTLHEMPLWYSLAAVTFVGGSLADFGGHTPFEPAAFDSAVLHGPHTSNFGQIYDQLDSAGAALLVTRTTITQRLQDVIENPTLRSGMIDKARLTVQAQSDKLSPFLDTILP